MSRKESVITVGDGKYTIRHIAGTSLRAERYGMPWRNLEGDGLVLALVHRIEELEEALTPFVEGGVA